MQNFKNRKNNFFSNGSEVLEINLFWSGIRSVLLQSTKIFFRTKIFLIHCSPSVRRVKYIQLKWIAIAIYYHCSPARCLKGGHYAPRKNVFYQYDVRVWWWCIRGVRSVKTPETMFFLATTENYLLKQISRAFCAKTMGVTDLTPLFRSSCWVQAAVPELSLFLRT